MVGSNAGGVWWVTRSRLNGNSRSRAGAGILMQIANSALIAYTPFGVETKF